LSLLTKWGAAQVYHRSEEHRECRERRERLTERYSSPA
jgi:hypothetical protein